MRPKLNSTSDLVPLEVLPVLDEALSPSMMSNQRLTPSKLSHIKSSSMGQKSSHSVKNKALSFMDDFCQKREVFLNDDDRTRHQVLKSKSQFGLFKRTVNSVFKSDRDYADVPGMD